MFDTILLKNRFINVFKAEYFSFSKIVEKLRKIVRCTNFK